jgi:hypothetical protein
MRTHGRIATYMVGCRCDECSAAKRAANALQRAARRACILPPGDARHGVNGYSNYGCRCHTCTVAWRRKSQRIERRLRRAVRLRGAA